MTFDDGILTVYSVSNAAEPGRKPAYRLEKKDSYYFGYDRIGITRHYNALQANQSIEAVVNIPDWNDVKVTDLVSMQARPEALYQIDFVQPDMDEDGLRIMKLTLGKVDQRYEVP